MKEINPKLVKKAFKPIYPLIFLFLGIISIITMILFYITPIIIKLVAYVFFYYYITLPVVFSLGITYKWFKRKKKLKETYEKLDSQEKRESFKMEFLKEPVGDNKLTEEYKEWLLPGGNSFIKKDSVYYILEKILTILLALGLIAIISFLCFFVLDFMT
ncbi:MAG: membrane protein of unknown function [Promethearchaeota archaeon]|nr:MAG: membrane protein of unknown function [Candidatus Lokiarchaeota archaeon]